MISLQPELWPFVSKEVCNVALKMSEQFHDKARFLVIDLHNAMLLRQKELDVAVINSSAILTDLLIQDDTDLLLLQQNLVLLPVVLI